MDAATETKPEEQETKPETVSMERFEEVNAKLKAAEDKNDVQQQNMALIAANATPAPKVEEVDPFKEVGLEGPEDIPNVGQSRKILSHYIGGVKNEMAQIRFQAQHSDFSQIVGDDEHIQSGQFSPPLMKAIKVNPLLLDQIKSSRNPSAAAYKAALQFAEKKTKKDETTTKTEAQVAIDEAVANSKTVKTSANAPGGNEGLSEEGRLAKMSDADFIKIFNPTGGDL